MDTVNGRIVAIGGFQTLSTEFLDCATGVWTSGPTQLGDYDLTNSAGVMRPSGEIVIGGGREQIPLPGISLSETRSTPLFWR
jgi:hypothetical protein